MVRTRVGYAGGTKRNPTYHSMGDHAESIQVDFDPSVLGYAELLDLFWSCHNPCDRAYSRQYMSAIFFHDEGQKRLALETKDREEKRRGRIATEILPLGTFTVAEDYHQKYYLRGEREIAKELLAVYPDPAAFRESTAAARLNGYIGGDGSAAALQGEIGRLGLSPAGRDRLRGYVR